MTTQMILLLYFSGAPKIPPAYKPTPSQASFTILYTVLGFSSILILVAIIWFFVSSTWSKKHYRLRRPRHLGYRSRNCRDRYDVDPSNNKGHHDGNPQEEGMVVHRTALSELDRNRRGDRGWRNNDTRMMTRHSNPGNIYVTAMARPPSSSQPGRRMMIMTPQVNDYPYITVQRDDWDSRDQPRDFHPGHVHPNLNFSTLPGFEEPIANTSPSTDCGSQDQMDSSIYPTIPVMEQQQHGGSLDQAMSEKEREEILRRFESIEERRRVELDLQQIESNERRSHNIDTTG